MFAGNILDLWDSTWKQRYNNVTGKQKEMTSKGTEVSWNASLCNALQGTVTGVRCTSEISSLPLRFISREDLKESFGLTRVINLCIWASTTAFAHRLDVKGPIMWKVDFKEIPRNEKKSIFFSYIAAILFQQVCAKTHSTRKWHPSWRHQGQSHLTHLIPLQG